MMFLFLFCRAFMVFAFLFLLVTKVVSLRFVLFCPGCLPEGKEGRIDGLGIDVRLG